MDDQLFKQAMGRFPSGVTIVTTVKPDGERCGFTASAFSSLSLSPPLVLVCLANTADCYQSFAEGLKFAINIVGIDHEELAFKFATKGVDKFDGGEFHEGPSGLPLVNDAVVSLECKLENAYPGGDHIILVGEVTHVQMSDNIPSVWYEGKWRHFDV